MKTYTRLAGYITLIGACRLAAFPALAGDDAAERPNILWINSEDNGAQWVSCYGSPNARTPHIDKLAEEGFRYRYCFSNSAVCAPTRTTWITGMHAISMGTEHMRSRYAIPNDRIPYYPDQLAKAGYRTAHISKTDYNIGSRPDGETWKTSPGSKDFSELAGQQPFFAFMTLGESHESQFFTGRYKTENDRFGADPEKMTLHPYHPDLPGVRDSYAKYANAVAAMDERFGGIMEDLKRNGLYDDTIVIYCSDHAGVMPRSKRYLYTSGTHCPLIVRIPDKWKYLWPAERPGMTVDRLVSFIDLPKTVLSLAGANIPDTFQGTVFLGEDVEPEPAYHFAYRGRADKCVDMVRSIRTKEFVYIKNYMPWWPTGQVLGYYWGTPIMRAWEEHHKAGRTDEVTGRFFRARPSEEFYVHADDYHNIRNLIDAPEHQATIQKLREELRRQQMETFDSGLLPEAMRMRRAKAYGMPVYDMVRRPDLYPLRKYLDYTDLVLAREPDNLSLFVQGLTDADEGIRFWAICGLFLLEEQALPAQAQVAASMKDEAVEVRLMAAWTLEELTGDDVAVPFIEALQAEREGQEKPDHADMFFSRAMQNGVRKQREYAQPGR